MNMDPWTLFTVNFGTFHAPYTAFVTLIDLFIYFLVSLNVGRARRKYKVEAPDTDGSVKFRRIYRVQMNTLEQMALHLPLLWLAAFAVGDPFAAAFGCIWPVGRVFYALGYYRDAKYRHKGFLVAMLSNFVLFASTLAGVIAAF